MRPVVTSSYKSGIPALTKDLDAKLERIVAQAARDGSGFVRASSRPPITAYATKAETSGGHVQAVVLYPRAQWWAVIFDKGSLGKRTIPLKQPGRREKSWPVKRRSSRRVDAAGVVSGARGTEYTAYRSARALAQGGHGPQYFLIRGKRHAEQKLAEYLKREF